MAGNVVPIGCITRLDIPSERVLSAALERNITDVIVLGYDEDGDFYFAASKANGGDVLWLLALAQKRLLQTAEDLSV